MSDPVTNAEVEDVLSSIRRLVSEDKRPQSSAAAARTDDRLVLTPALRVAASDGADTADETPVEAAVEDALADYLETEEAAQTSEADDHDVADELADELAEDTPFDFVGSAKAPEDDAADMATFRRADVADEDMGDDMDDGAVDDDETADELVEDHLELDWDDADDADASEQAAAAPSGDTTEMDSKAGTLSAKIAALETAIGAIDQEWEPDDAGTDDYSGTDAPAMDWEDDDTGLDSKGSTARAPVAEPAEKIDDVDFEAAEDTSRTPMSDAAMEDAQADLDETVAAEDDATQTAGLGIDDQLIDEEALRDLVSDIVRAELQGALGERITRNVRKLVRREIHRALATQDLQ